jgi:alkylation response protein AidB-like acyl-CoA dehydrogenase
MDLALDAEEQEFLTTFQRFFERESPLERVRKAEPVGFDEALWGAAVEIGIPGMALSRQRGGASVMELVLLAELVGRHLAPIPIIETVCAIRLLDSLAVPGAAATLVDEAVAGQIVTVAQQSSNDTEQLVPAGGVAEVVLAERGDQLLAFGPSSRRRRCERVHGSVPLGVWSLTPDAETVVVAGDGAKAAADAARDLWKILTAAALMGVARRAIEIGAEYATGRWAFGTQIGAFQGVAHPLADSATEIDGGELLVRRAAWLLDRGERSAASHCATLCAGFCSSAATRATTRAVHVHGGYGAALEYDIQLFHQRARAGQALIGDPDEQFRQAGERLLAEGGR